MLGWIGRQQFNSAEATTLSEHLTKVWKKIENNLAKVRSDYYNQEYEFKNGKDDTKK